MSLEAVTSLGRVREVALFHLVSIVHSDQFEHAHK